MSRSAEPSRPAWTRRAPGSAVIGFISLSGGLWFLTLLAWEVRLAEIVVALLAAGAFLPLVHLAVRLWRRPVWALEVRADPRRVAGVLSESLNGPHPTSIGTLAMGPAASLRGCDPLWRLRDPDCLLGVRPSESSGTVLLLHSPSGDRRAVGRLLATIERTARTTR